MAPPEPRLLLGVGCACGALACWTAAPLLIKFLSGVLTNAHTQNGWRFLVAVLSWTPFLMKRARAIPRVAWKRALVPASLMSIGQISLVLAIYLVSATMAVFALRSMMVSAAIGSAIAFPCERRLLRQKRFLAAGAVLLGGSVGVAALGEKGLGERNTAEGVVLSFLSGIVYGLYGVATSALLTSPKRVPAVERVTANEAFAVQCVFIFVVMAVAFFVWGENQWSELAAMDGRGWAAFLFSAWTGIAIGHALYFRALDEAGACVATAIIQLQPLTVGIGSYLCFDERFTPGQLVSGLVAIGGAAAMVWTKTRLKEDRAEEEEDEKEDGDGGGRQHAKAAAITSSSRGGVEAETAAAVDVKSVELQVT